MIETNAGSVEVDGENEKLQEHCDILEGKNSGDI
jgi:hypothetical protein